MSGPFADDEKCQEFAANLKSMLDAFKWQRADLAVACNFSASVISNILTFQRPPTVQQGEAFDGAFRLKDVFAKAAREIRGESFTPVFRKFSDYEREADTLLIYEHSFVPGLVQTERYAHAVIETWPNITKDETERLVAARLGRQEILARDTPPKTFMLVDEGSLRRPAAEPDVMYEQCMHLLEVSRMPAMSLSVVPYTTGGHMGLLGAFWIAERQGHPSIVYLEDAADGRVCEDDPVILNRLELRFRSLQQEALSTRASRDVIARIAEEVWNPTAPPGARALTVVPTAEHV
jgi:hypothetical protein